MNRYIAGLLAGLAATIAVSVLMIANSAMGLWPGVDVIGMLAGLLGSSRAAAWIVHLSIGTVAWGLGFALVYRGLPGHSFTLRGVLFATAAWLAMMLVLMPLAGARLFGLELGVIAPALTFALHLLFGAVLGLGFRGLLRTPATADPGPRKVEPSGDLNRPDTTAERFDHAAHPHRHAIGLRSARRTVD